MIETFLSYGVLIKNAVVNFERFQIELWKNLENSTLLISFGFSSAGIERFGKIRTAEIIKPANLWDRRMQQSWRCQTQYYSNVWTIPNVQTTIYNFCVFQPGSYTKKLWFHWRRLCIFHINMFVVMTKFFNQLMWVSHLFPYPMKKWSQNRTKSFVHLVQPWSKLITEFQVFR